MVAICAAFTGLVCLSPMAPPLSTPASPPLTCALQPLAARPHSLLSPQVDELMRQELKNLHLVVDKEEERPLKSPKAR